jgi:hypothetical protein
MVLDDQTIETSFSETGRVGSRPFQNLVYTAFIRRCAGERQQVYNADDDLSFAAKYFDERVFPFRCD